MKGKLPPKFTMPNFKLRGYENPYQHMRKFVITMTLSGIDKGIFHLIFSWTFVKVVMRWCSTLDPWKITNWVDLCREFLRQY